MACYGSFEGILTGLAKSADHPSMALRPIRLTVAPLPNKPNRFASSVPTYKKPVAHNYGLLSLDYGLL